MPQSMDAQTRTAQAAARNWDALTEDEKVARINKVYGMEHGSFVVIKTASGNDHFKVDGDSKLGQRIGWAITKARSSQTPTVVEAITSLGQVADFKVDLTGYEPKEAKANGKHSLDLG